MRQSLAEHPAAMTHSAVEPHKRKEFGIADNLIRLSVGVEATEDIIWDLDQALSQILYAKNNIQPRSGS